MISEKCKCRCVEALSTWKDGFNRKEIADKKNLTAKLVRINSPAPDLGLTL